MSALNSTNYQTKFNDGTTGLYRNGQGVGAITPEDHRTLVEDTKDSFHNTQENLSVSFDPLTPAINLRSSNVPLIVIGSSTISSNVIVTLSNDTFHPSFTFIFTTSGSPYLQFPATFKSSDVRWDNSNQRFTPVEAGRYKAFADWDGSSWLIDFSQSIYS